MGIDRQPRAFWSNEQGTTSEQKNIYCVTYHDQKWMSAGHPLLRVAPRAPNKGPNNGLDQTLGVPHERKFK